MQLSNFFYKTGFVSLVFIGIVFQISLAQNTILTAQNSSKDSVEVKSDFLIRFETAELPYQSDETLDIQDTIPAQTVIDNILEAARKVSPQTFKELWENEELQEITRKGLEDRYINIENNAFAVVNFGFVNKLKISEKFHTVIFKYIPTFMEGFYSYTFLANYDLEGNMIDVVRIAGLATYIDIQNTWTASVDREGKIEIKGQNIKKADMFGQDKDFVETFELNYKINDTGKISLTSQKYSGFSGSFQAKNEEKMLRIEEFFDQMNILYQSSSEDFAEQALEIIHIDKEKNKIIAQFPDTLEQVTLTYNNSRTELTCTDKSGKKLEYLRTNN